jgi:hypothetical protein
MPAGWVGPGKEGIFEGELFGGGSSFRCVVGVFIDERQQLVLLNFR